MFLLIDGIDSKKEALVVIKPEVAGEFFKEEAAAVLNSPQLIITPQGAYSDNIATFVLRLPERVQPITLHS